MVRDCGAVPEWQPSCLNFPRLEGGLGLTILPQMFEKAQIADSFDRDKRIVLFGGDGLKFLQASPTELSDGRHLAAL